MARQLADGEGRRWEARVISSGRTSGYLSAKVHRPILEFTCLDARTARRYGRLPPGEDRLDALTEGELLGAFRRSQPH